MFATALPELKDLFTELYSKANKWEDIGIMLKIEDSILSRIKIDHNNDCTGCLREMLRAWLKSVDPQPSWSSVIECLRCVEENPLAEKLQSKYNNI